MRPVLISVQVAFPSRPPKTPCLKPTEHLLRIPSQDPGLLLIAQPLHLLDERPDVVVPAAGAGVGLGAGAGPLAAEEAAVGLGDLEEKLQGLGVVEGRVEVELAQAVVEVLGVVWGRGVGSASGPPGRGPIRRRGR